ncbi:ArgS-related anticodon-binding protein NrtL [Streptomyces sp. NBC_00572]|uniref:ArgS-related anticodon-binding protein NrtL n=1 Tax=Streptomyces sp. NBC_00572 TaxID=2903664 RepID=UPI00224F442A|nr:DALR anticodon-binding domain-containing protein [Streptomyces sp. NBC_00572]MCX4983475.1 DALR anticodon-binding domain-containing protein [Streptomyces sp. NBC_00572]
MTPADLSLTVLHAVRRAVDDGALRVDVPPTVKVERVRPGGAGEYASSIALSLARSAGRPALDVAGILEERLRDAPGLREVVITGPGFLNFSLRRDADAELVRAIREAGDSYGTSDALAGTTVRFAGPPDLTESRALLVTETVVRLLRSQGADAGFAELAGFAGFIGPSDDERGESGERIHVRAGAYEGDVLGVDAARWALLRPSPQDRPLDGPPLLVQHERNSLFRVRYAYSRVRRLLVNGRQLGVVPVYEHDAPPLHAPELLGVLRDHPVVLLAAARHRAPDRVARHLEATADALLAFQHTVLPLGDEKPSAAHRSRLALAEAAGTVLAGGLAVLGISAPERI